LLFEVSAAHTPAGWLSGIAVRSLFRKRQIEYRADTVVTSGVSFYFPHFLEANVCKIFFLIVKKGKAVLVTGHGGP
jgi:hypothetical protein